MIIASAADGGQIKVISVVIISIPGYSRVAKGFGGRARSGKKDNNIEDERVLVMREISSVCPDALIACKGLLITKAK